MKPDWHPDELARHFTLSNPERLLLGNKSGATRLAFALLLKTFQLDGCFPESPNNLPINVVSFIAEQCGVLPDLIESLDWEGRTARTHRLQVREYLGSTAFHSSDEPKLIDWLEGHVTDFDPNSESFRHAALGHLRSSRIEIPSRERLTRLIREAVKKREARFVSETAGLLSLETRAALDSLVTIGTDADTDELQPEIGRASWRERV